MGFFGKLWTSAKSLGKKVLGWGHKAHAIGKKAHHHYEKAQVIGQKVRGGYDHGKALFHEARQLDSLDKAMDFAKREAGKGAQYSAAADKLTQDARSLGRDARRDGAGGGRAGIDRPPCSCPVHEKLT